MSDLNSAPGNSQLPGTSQPPLGAVLKQAAGDPRTTNILLAVLVLCITGYMPDGFETVCSA